MAEHTTLIVGASLGGALVLTLAVAVVAVCVYRSRARRWQAAAERAKEAVPSVNSLEVGTPNPAFIGDSQMTTNPLFAEAGVKLGHRPPSVLGVRRDDVALAKTDVRSLGGTFHPVSYYGDTSEAEDQVYSRQQAEKPYYPSQDPRGVARYPRNAGPPEARHHSRYHGSSRSSGPNSAPRYPRSDTPERHQRMNRASMPSHSSPARKPGTAEPTRPVSQYGEPARPASRYGEPARPASQYADRRPTRQPSRPREDPYRPEEAPVHPQRQSARRPPPANDRREFKGPYGPEDIY